MNFTSLTESFANYAWGSHMLVLLVGGGLFFLIYSGFAPFKYLFHGVSILFGKYPEKNAPGEISHAGALSSAMAGTVGMGNIASVAVAIVVGGPGAIFWMWISAIVGMATKFFTCSLAIMYRGRDDKGQLQGGPMYIIVEGLGSKWRFLAVFFCLVGLIGNLPLFNANQLVQIVKDSLIVKSNIILTVEQDFWLEFTMGIILMLLVGIVIIGGIKRIANVAKKLIPTMIFIYLASAIYIIVTHFQTVPYYLSLIVTEAFSSQSLAGGILGTMLIGIRRATFSNEAGIGTEVMAHSCAKTKQPIREGLVAMLGPAIDTLLVCTATALIILISGVWQTEGVVGVSLTAMAFDQTIPVLGSYLLLICVFFFSISTIFTQAFYGGQCFKFLFGSENLKLYQYFYLIAILFASTTSIDAVINIIDGSYALMAIPTMISALLLAPKVKAAAKLYFSKL